MGMNMNFGSGGGRQEKGLLDNDYEDDGDMENNPKPARRR